MPISHEEAVARYRRIVEAREAGSTLEDIAQAEGVSRERIRQILEKGEPPNPTGRPPGEPEAELPTYREFLMNTTLLDKPPTDDDVKEVAKSYLPSVMKVGPMVVPNKMAFATLRPSDMEDFALRVRLQRGGPTVACPAQARVPA